MARAREAFDTFAAAVQRAVHVAETQAVGAQTGAKEIGEVALGFVERNAASSSDFVLRLLVARERRDVMSLHVVDVRAQIAGLTAQAIGLRKSGKKRPLLKEVCVRSRPAAAHSAAVARDEIPGFVQCKNIYCIASILDVQN